jgi:hypothetical protein
MKEKEDVWEGLENLCEVGCAQRLPSLFEQFGNPFSGEVSALMEFAAANARLNTTIDAEQARLETCKVRVEGARKKSEADRARRQRDAAKMEALERAAGVGALSPEQKRALQQAVYAVAGVPLLSSCASKGRWRRARFPSGYWATIVEDRLVAMRARSARARERKRVWLSALKNLESLTPHLPRLLCDL